MNDNTRDLALFAKIAEGDEAAFTALFELYAPEVHRVIYSLVTSPVVAQDIAQEVFLYLWLGRDKLADIADPAGWIFRIVYNRSFKYLRRQKTQREKQARLAQTQAQAAVSYSADSEQAMDFSDILRLVSEAIDQLPDQPKRIYQLNRLHGQRPADIASELGISIQGVRNSLTRSGKLIRAYLSERGVQIPLILLVFYGT